MNHNLSLYHIFNCVAETGNISHAAHRLFISQPAVSKSITSLEESLNVVLFARNSRGVKLTDAGTLLYEYTRTAFDTLGRGIDALKQMQDFEIGHLRIGVSATLCKYILLPYLNQFVKDYPHIKISIENQSTYHTLKQLENGLIDIGLVTKPDPLKQFQFYPTGKIEDIFVATQSYLDHLKLREQNTDLFSTATILLMGEENVSRKYIEHYFSQHKIEPQHILEVGTMDLLIEFAKTSLGIACVIKEFVQKELDNGTLVQIPLKNAINKREVGFSYGKNTYLSEIILKFIQHIKTHSNH